MLKVRDARVVVSLALLSVLFFKSSSNSSCICCLYRDQDNCSCSSFNQCSDGAFVICPDN